MTLITLAKRCFADEALERLAGLAVVRDGNAGPEEARDHLAPAIEGLAGLIGGGGITRNVNGRYAVGLFDFNCANGGMRTGEFKGEFVVPGPGFGGLFRGLLSLTSPPVEIFVVRVLTMKVYSSKAPGFVTIFEASGGGARP